MRDELELLLLAVRDAGALDDNNGGENWIYSDFEIDKALKLLTQRELQSRLDENDIWLAHSTSRVIDNDDKPAIRSSDFKERMSELQAQLNSLQGE